jgi:hypothetical protein
MTISANQPIDRSVLAGPRPSQQAQQPPAAPTSSENWGLGWDGKTGSQTAPAAITGNRYDTATISAGSDTTRDRGFGASQQPGNTQATQPGSQPGQTFGIGAFDKPGWPEDPATPQAGAAASGSLAGNAAPPPPIGSTTNVVAPQNVAGTSMPAVQQPQVAGTAPSLPSPPGDQLPWLPLLVVSLALAGSIGANLFLGYSYADARHKYRTLVQKTAHKFRRAVAA